MVEVQDHKVGKVEKYFYWMPGCRLSAERCVVPAF